MLKNMGVGARLLLLGGTLIVMIGLVAGVGITRLSSLGEIITEIAEEDIPLGSKITEVTINQLEQAVAFEQALRHAQLMDKSAAERTAFKHAVDRFEEHAELADEEIKEAEELVRHGQEVYGTNAAALAEYKKLEEMFQSLDKHHAAYEEHARAVFVTLAQGQIHEGMEAAEKVEEEEKRVDKEAEEALYEIQRFTLLEAQNAEAMELSAVRFLWGLSVTAILLAAFASYALGRSISKPLGEAERVLREVADGDFTQTFHYEAKDEIGRMGQALTALLQKLRSSMTDIAANAETLSTSSEELSAVSEQMSGNAEETAKQSSVTAATSEQVSRNVSTVATSAEEITASIKEVAKSATASARIASEAVDVASKTNATITRLGESSNEIGNVLKMITSIAQQTNLLALNATIEAARAGEAGKGFAVVANEVKELARQTAEATEEISQKVERLQDDSRQSVAAIAQITEVIEKINGISSSIATSVEEQSTTTAEMGRNLVEAAQGTTEISSNVTGVAKAAESTTTGANQTRESAAELARMAGVLKQTVSQFKYN